LVNNTQSSEDNLNQKKEKSTSNQVQKRECPIKDSITKKESPKIDSTSKKVSPPIKIVKYQDSLTFNKNQSQESLNENTVSKKKLPNINKNLPGIPLKDSDESNFVEALYNFKGEKENELNIEKGDHLIITNWKAGDGWVAGYKKGNKEQFGIFPKNFVIQRLIRNKSTDNLKGLYILIHSYTYNL